MYHGKGMGPEGVVPLAGVNATGGKMLLNLPVHNLSPEDVLTAELISVGILSRSDECNFQNSTLFRLQSILGLSRNRAFNRSLLSRQEMLFP